MDHTKLYSHKVDGQAANIIKPPTKKEKKTQTISAFKMQANYWIDYKLYMYYFYILDAIIGYFIIILLF